MNNGKLVHEETYKEHSVKVYAEYIDDYEMQVNDEWFEGRVMFYATAEKKNANKPVEIYPNPIDDNDFWVSFKRKVERYGFLKLRKQYSIVHISEEYERVFPLLLSYCKKRVDKIADREERMKHNQKITDGLPDSLREL